MLRHALFLVFLCGIESCRGSGSSSAVQQQTLDSKDVYQNGMKKNELGANGLEPNRENVLRNFRNPVLEYLLHSTPDRTNTPPRKGILREIRHSQTLLVPGPMPTPWPALFLNQLPQFESLKKPVAEGNNNPESSPVDAFWNFLKNKTGDKSFESVVTSPVLHLNKDHQETKEKTTVQTYPAIAVVINTFDKDGSLRKSATHFQPDFHSLRPDTNARADYAMPNKVQNAVVNFEGRLPGKGSPQTVPWPFASYFPIVVHDPFLTVYNAFATSMYNAVSSVVEYGPEADVCVKERKQTTPVVADPGVFGEVTMRSEKLERAGGERRQRRDATSILVKAREGGTVGITLEEPTDGNNGEMSEGSDLVLRKGGIAIAGPGGAATAYTGGTAIVGPYGTVYKSPEGTAILGPFAKVVHITDDTTFEEILKMHRQMKGAPSVENRQRGPFKNFLNFFSYATRLPVKFELKPRGRSFPETRPGVARLREEGVLKALQEIRDTEFGRTVEDAPFEELGAKDNQTTLVFRPKSRAEAGRNGVALSAPTSHAILYPGQRATVYFEPESVASAGPSGFAHAQSELFVTYVRNGTRMGAMGHEY